MSPFRIIILFIAAIALALTTAACGGGSSGAQEIVDEATLEGVESGNLDLSLGIDTKGEDLDIDLSGPFKGKGGQSRELDLTATVQGTTGGKEVDFKGTLTVLGGNKAYVEFEGTDYKVDATTYRYGKEVLDEPEEVSACQEAVSDMPLSDFIEDPTEEGTAKVGGTSTTKVSGGVDAETVNEALDVMSEDALCEEQLKAVPSLQSTLTEFEESKENGDDAFENGRIVLYIGEDHIVRCLQAQVTIKPPEGQASGGAKGGDYEIDLTLTDVNEPQTITAPKSTKPVSALFIKLGISPTELLGVVQGGIPGLTRFLERVASAGGGK